MGAQQIQKMQRGLFAAEERVAAEKTQCRQFRLEHQKQVEEHAPPKIQNSVLELDEFQEEPFDPADPDSLVRKQAARAAAEMAQHKQEMEQFRLEHQKQVEEHAVRIQNLTKELEELQEEPFDPADPDRLERKQAENFQKFCDAAGEHMKGVPKYKTCSIAVLGPSGVGKSTILNGLAGREVAAVDVIECTDKISMVHATDKWDMYDVPGSRDEKADYYNVDNLYKLAALHLILVVYTDRFEHVLNVHKLLKTLQIPHIFVRNKCNFEREGDDLERAKIHEQKKAGDVALVYLGYAKHKGDVPVNIELLREAMVTQLGHSGGG